MITKELRAAVDAFVAANEENVVRDIKRLVDINSVEGTPEPGKPFGAGPAAALDEALKMAAEMGLSTNNCEGYMGWAELPGETDKQIATITHLDVVPQGNGWTADPFDMQVRDGWIIGRGVADDKGPSVLCLYALKFLKEHNVPLKYGVRALLGANEETGMEDVEYYLKNYPAPDFCFSPDAEFPVCNGEKGGYQRLSGFQEAENGNILEFHRRRSPQRGAGSGFLPGKGGLRFPERAWRASRWKRRTARCASAAGAGAGPCSHAQNTVNSIGLIVNYLLDNNWSPPMRRSS